MSVTKDQLNAFGLKVETEMKNPAFDSEQKADLLTQHLEMLEKYTKEQLGSLQTKCQKDAKSLIEKDTQIATFAAQIVLLKTDLKSKSEELKSIKLSLGDSSVLQLLDSITQLEREKAAAAADLVKAQENYTEALAAAQAQCGSDIAAVEAKFQASLRGCQGNLTDMEIEKEKFKTQLETETATFAEQKADLEKDYEAKRVALESKSSQASADQVALQTQIVREKKKRSDILQTVRDAMGQPELAETTIKEAIKLKLETIQTQQTKLEQLEEKLTKVGKSIQAAGASSQSLQKAIISAVS